MLESDANAYKTASDFICTSKEFTEKEVMQRPNQRMKA
jgi:hypothetical protein